MYVVSLQRCIFPVDTVNCWYAASGETQCFSNDWAGRDPRDGGNYQGQDYGGPLSGFYKGYSCPAGTYSNFEAFNMQKVTRVSRLWQKLCFATGDDGDGAECNMTYPCSPTVRLALTRNTEVASLDAKS